jgi:NADH dehydrogenase
VTESQPEFGFDSAEVVMNLVVGASGMLGAEICSRLTEDGNPVRALVRNSTDPAKQDKLRSLGASLSYGDLKDRSTLEAACRGISTVISTASSTFSRQPADSIDSVDHEGQLNLVRAAQAAGVRHFIFISFPPAPGDFALQRAKRAVETELAGSGLPFTVLQPTFFTEVWLSPAVGFDPSRASAQIYGSGQNKISWISYLDVAKFAAGSVDNPAARNTVVKLGGPAALSPLEVVQIFEEISGRKFSVNHLPEEALRAQKAAAADSLQEAFAALMLYYAHGEVIDMKAASRIFPGQASDLTSISDYARSLLRAASA